MALFIDGKFYCECGCGSEIDPWNTWKHGHSWSVENRRRQREGLTESHVRALEKAWAECSEGERVKRLEAGLLSEEGKRHQREALSELYKDLDFTRNITRGLRDANEKKQWEAFQLEMYRLDTLEKGGRGYCKCGCGTRINLVRTWAVGHYAKGKPNNCELLLWADIQEELGLGWTMNVVGGRVVADRIPDFINEERKQIIELFGGYWHDLTYFYRLSEEELIEHYGKYGYDCIVVWSDLVRDGTSFLELRRFKVGKVESI